MSIYSDVRTAVRSGVLKVFEGVSPAVEVIYSHLNGTEPPNPYVVVQIVNVQQKGRVQTATFTDDGDEFGENKNLWFKTHYEVMVQFSFCGSTAGDLAFEFNNAILNNVVIQEEFQKSNLSPIRKSLLRRAPMLRDTQWIEYQNMDVTFSYAVQTIQPIDWVEKVVLVDEVSGETFTIPETPFP